MRRQVPNALGLLLLAFFVAFPFVYTGHDYAYVMHILITAFFYAILASSWSMLAGYAGQFSFGHIGFMGIGAYTAALFSHYLWLSPRADGALRRVPDLAALAGRRQPDRRDLDDADAGLPATGAGGGGRRAAGDAHADLAGRDPVGTLTGGLFGFLVGVLVLRLRAAYLALFTLGFAEIVRATISAEIWLTRGQAGIEMPPLFPDGITLFGRHFGETAKLPPYYVMLGLLLLCLGILAWLARSRFGLFVRALREDQDAAAALGVDTTRYKVLVFVVTTMMAAAAGAVQGYYVGIITPNNLFLLQMSLVVAMAVIGGVENFVAAALGAILIQFALEMLRNSFTVGRRHGRHDGVAAGRLRHPADAGAALLPQRADRAGHHLFHPRPRRRRDGREAPRRERDGHRARAERRRGARPMRSWAR